MTTISVGLLLAGCSEADVDPEATGDTVDEVAGDAREQAEDAFADLRTDAERLVDDIQTEDAPEAKDELLEQCREALERLREAESDAADQVSQICDQIQETDVSNAEVWNTIRQQINDLEMN